MDEQRKLQRRFSHQVFPPTTHHLPCPFYTHMATQPQILVSIFTLASIREPITQHDKSATTSMPFSVFGFFEPRCREDVTPALAFPFHTYSGSSPASSSSVVMIFGPAQPPPARLHDGFESHVTSGTVDVSFEIPFNEFLFSIGTY